MAIRFERLISRSVAVALSKELDMTGLKASVEGVARTAVVGIIAMIVIIPFIIYSLTPFKNPLIDFVMRARRGGAVRRPNLLLLRIHDRQEEDEDGNVLPRLSPDRLGEPEERNIAGQGHVAGGQAGVRLLLART